MLATMAIPITCLPMPWGGVRRCRAHHGDPESSVAVGVLMYHFENRQPLLKGLPECSDIFARLRVAVVATSRRNVRRCSVPYMHKLIF